MRNLGFLAVAVGLAGLASGCAPVAAETSAGRAANVGAALCRMGFSAIPMRALASGHHVVEVSLNGKPATFVVDTGAGATAIHAPYASTLLGQASATARGQAIGAGGTTALSSYQVEALSIGGTATDLRQIYALDLTSVVKALEPLAGGPVHGIIGQDVMRAQHGVVDVQQSVLYLMPVNGAKARC